MLEKVATKNNLSDTSGKIFSIGECFKKTNNKPDSVITEEKSKNVHFITLGRKRKNYSDSTLL
jgi:hypothetical protein